MKDIFRDLIPLDEDEARCELDQATIVLDANVLLDMYRHSESTSEHFLILIEAIQGRLWMPYQVGYEFLKNRPSIRAEMADKHNLRIKELEGLQNRIRSSEKKSHVGNDDSEKEFLESLSRYIGTLSAERDLLRAQATKSGPDPILRSIMNAHHGRTASRPSEQWLTENEKTGAARYKTKTPPGYEDDVKEKNKYGDYFLWRESIEQCKASGTPLLIVTEDSKEDWLHVSRGQNKQVLGPRHELVQEFHKETGQRFFMKNSAEFLYYLRTLIDKEAEDALGLAAQEELDAQQSENAAAIKNNNARIRAEIENFRKDLATYGQPLQGTLPSFEPSIVQGLLPTFDPAVWNSFITQNTGVSLLDFAKYSNQIRQPGKEPTDQTFFLRNHPLDDPNLLRDDEDPSEDSENL